MPRHIPQFDERYRMEPIYREQASLRRQSSRLLEQQRALLRDQPRRPPTMPWFEEAMQNGPEEGLPSVGYFCHTVPVEIIYAAGARPVRLGCGNPVLAQAGEDILTGEICPLVKASYGAFLDAASLPNRCAALVVSATCDAKRKLGELLADYRPTFTLPVPPEQDFRAFGDQAARDIDRLRRFLEQTLKRRIRRTSLLEAMRSSARRALLMRALMDARAVHPEALSYRDVQVIIQALQAGAHPDAWEQQVEQILDGVRTFEPQRPRLRPRIILTGAPIIWPNFKLLHLIEECGADMVSDTLCSGFQSMVDPLRVDEHSRSALLRALAARYLFSSPCPCFISQGIRISRIVDLVDELRADGVIHYGLRLCPLFDMEMPRLQQTLRARGIPFINLRTDYSPEDTEQLRVRLEAFLETVVDAV